MSQFASNFGINPLWEPNELHNFNDNYNMTAGIFMFSSYKLSLLESTA